MYWTCPDELFHLILMVDSKTGMIILIKETRKLDFGFKKRFILFFLFFTNIYFSRYMCIS